jgi:AhpD family alkylhydroperoxidase
MTLESRYKRRFDLREVYGAAVLLPPHVAGLARNRRRRTMDRHAVERIMLAVTEVNGCPACSWAHTRMALREGMSGEEISALLSGDGGVVPPDEATGVVFAQHYADSRARPDRDAYDALVGESGPERARTVLAAAHVMHVANMHGIPFSAFHARLHGQPYRDSTLGYEVGMQVAGAVILPVALVHGLVRCAAGFPPVRFATVP